MKGPFGRVKLNANRHWRCPRCGRETSSLGTVISQSCECPSLTGDDAPTEPVWMTYLEKTGPTEKRKPAKVAASAPDVEVEVDVEVDVEDSAAGANETPLASAPDNKEATPDDKEAESPPTATSTSTSDTPAQPVEGTAAPSPDDEASPDDPASDPK